MGGAISNKSEIANEQERTSQQDTMPISDSFLKIRLNMHLVFA